MSEDITNLNTLARSYYHSPPNQQPSLKKELFEKAEQYVRRTISKFVSDWYSSSGRFHPARIPPNSNPLEYVSSALEKLNDELRKFNPEKKEFNIFLYHIVYSTVNRLNKKKARLSPPNKNNIPTTIRLEQLVNDLDSGEEDEDENNSENYLKRQNGPPPIDRATLSPYVFPPHPETTARNDLLKVLSESIPALDNIKNPPLEGHPRALRYIISHRYNLPKFCPQGYNLPSSQKPTPRKNLAKILGCTIERVRMLESEAIRQLYCALLTHPLTREYFQQ